MRLDCNTLSLVPQSSLFSVASLVPQFSSFAVAEPHSFVSSAVALGFIVVSLFAVADSLELALFAIVLGSVVESIDFFYELWHRKKRAKPRASPKRERNRSEVR